MQQLGTAVEFSTPREFRLPLFKQVILCISGESCIYIYIQIYMHVCFCTSPFLILLGLKFIFEGFICLRLSKPICISNITLDSLPVVPRLFPSLLQIYQQKPTYITFVSLNSFFHRFDEITIVIKLRRIVKYIKLVARSSILNFN